MDDKKIAFISCVNDDDAYKECLRFIDSLEIPEGYTIEKVAIRNARSLTSGYNDGMKKTNAKYKIYIHQDTYIINKSILFDILDVFKDEKVGMIGAAGAATIPPSGMWWDSLDTDDSIYHNPGGSCLVSSKHKVSEDRVIDVKAIDGLIMITQYDINWREDIFDNWHFYDVSQCMEFLKSGYEIKMIKKVESWVIHDCGVIWVSKDNTYHKYRNIFLNEYSKFLFPLVSIVITSYNRPNYFVQALESAINQTYLNKEIVIVDNSTNDEVMKVMDNYKEYDYIRYYKNEKELEVIENFNKGVKLAKSKYVALLMDDDLFHEDKLTKMMKYFIGDNSISLVTSKRTCIDRNGDIIRDRLETERLTLNELYINEKFIKDSYKLNIINFLGETTVPIFRKDLLKGRFGEYKGIQYKVISDLVTWISLLEEGKAVFLETPLSYFRNHPNQDQRRDVTIITGILEMIDICQRFYIESNDVVSKEKFDEIISRLIEYKILIKDKKLDLDEKYLKKILNQLKEMKIDMNSQMIDTIIKKMKII